MPGAKYEDQLTEENNVGVLFLWVFCVKAWLWLMAVTVCTLLPATLHVNKDVWCADQLQPSLRKGTERVTALHKAFANRNCGVPMSLGWGLTPIPPPPIFNFNCV